MQPVKIPVKQAEGFAIANGLKQVIIFGHDGENTHILTWGDTVEASAQAAAGANHVKQQWGWPAVNIVESEKVLALREELAAVIATNTRLTERAENAEQRLNELSRAPQVKATNHNGQQVAAAVGRRHHVHVIQGTEYERGWGCRPDGFKAFFSAEAARNFITWYDKNVNNAATVPHDYTKYDYIGIKECSHTFFASIDDKTGVYFDKLQDLDV